MYKHDRRLQYYPLGTHCVSSVISVLHVQILEEDTERRLDVPGRNTVVRNWYCAQQPFPNLLPWSVESLILKVTLLLFQVLKQCLLIWGILISCQYRWINICCKLTFFFLYSLLEAIYGKLFFLIKISWQIAFTCMVYPALILAYMGQAAYLCKHHTMESEYKIGFYVSVPGKLCDYAIRIFHQSVNNEMVSYS